MRENIAIVILLVATTLIYSLVMVNVYDNTVASEGTAGSSAVSEDTVPSGETAFFPAETVTPTPAPAPVISEGPETEEEETSGRLPVSIAGMSICGRWTEDEDDLLNAKEQITPTPTPVDLIIDLDYNSDVDDTAALRIAAMLDRMGRVHLKAAMSSTGGEKVCKAMHAQLSYDGYGSVPIGASAQNTPGGSPYWDDLIDHYFTAGDYRVYNSVELYKSVLRELDRIEKDKEKERKRYKKKFECKDEDLPEELKAVQKLKIVTTGYLVNVAGLLQDPEGYSLVCRYVDSIWVTGGVYMQGDDHNFICTTDIAESARYVLDKCPVTLIFSSSASIDNEDGSSIFCGASIQKLDTRGTDPVAMAYRDYAKANNTSLIGGRYAWDPFCLWAACLPMEETQTHLEAIYLSIDHTGRNRFSYDVPANCQIIRRNTDEQGWYTTQLDLLINAGLR